MWLGTGRIKTAAELPTLSTIKKEADISNAENEPEVKAEPVRMQKHFRLNKVKVEKDEKPQEAFLHKIKTEVIEVDPDKRMLKETTEPTKQELKLKDIKLFTGPVKFLPIQPLPLEHGKKFTCDICKKGVGTKGGLKYHIQAHLVGRPFKCDICKRSYATKNDFDTHNKRHSGKNVICNFCQKQFPVKSYLADHILLKHLPRELVCHICSKPRYYFRKTELEKHLTYVHYSKLKCKLCNVTYKSKKLFNLHCQQRLLMKYECKVCLEKFPCNKLYVAHMKAEMRNVECPICKKMVAKLKSHTQNIHMKVKCDICDVRLTGSKLNHHKKRCGTEEQIRALGHQCKLCSLFFRTENMLVIHTNQNHGTFQCSKCPKKFETKIKRYGHFRRSHWGGKFPYTCVICPGHKNFATKDRFIVHFNRFHKFAVYIRDRKRIKTMKYSCDQCKRCFPEKKKADFLWHIEKVCYKPIVKTIQTVQCITID